MSGVRAAGLPLERLPEALRATAVLPADPRYGALQHTYTSRGRPGAVLRPRTAAEVAASLAFARAADVPLSVRSGGHGISSRSTNDGGVVIDLGGLDDVRVLDRAARRVRIGPGARWGAVARVLAPHGLAISSGDSGDVGVGGLATTGGLGLVSRLHGLTIDHLDAAVVVTADGGLREVGARSTGEDGELFWGLRGAGANFGVVTSFDFTADALGRVAHATLAYDAADAAGLLLRWAEAVEAAPRELTAFLYLFAGHGGRAPSAVTAVLVADEDAANAQEALRPFTAVAPVVGSRARLTTYDDVVTTTGVPHSGAAGAATRSALVTHVDGALAGEMAALLASGDADVLQLRAVGGAVNDVPPEATAYAHRHQNFSLMVGPAPARRRSLWDRWDALHPHFDGMYLSFETDTRPERLLDAFPAPTLRRLRALKGRIDPDGVFGANFDLAAA